VSDESALLITHSALFGESVSSEKDTITVVTVPGFMINGSHTLLQLYRDEKANGGDKEYTRHILVSHLECPKLTASDWTGDFQLHSTHVNIAATLAILIILFFMGLKLCLVRKH